MGLLGGIFNAVTSPVRLVGHVAGAALNGIKVACDVATFNFKDAGRDLGEMGNSLKHAAFAGVETGGLFLGPWGWAGSALVGTIESGTK